MLPEPWIRGKLCEFDGGKRRGGAIPFCECMRVCLPEFACVCCARGELVLTGVFVAYSPFPLNKGMIVEKYYQLS
jgi:hypothetical protein